MQKVLNDGATAYLGRFLVQEFRKHIHWARVYAQFTCVPAQIKNFLLKKVSKRIRQITDGRACFWLNLESIYIGLIVLMGLILISTLLVTGNNRWVWSLICKSYWSYG